MPQRMFRESRTGCKELGPDASPLERLALQPNVHRSGSDAGMTKGLNDAPGRAAFFPAAFVSGLAVRRLHAAPRSSGEGHRRDAPEHPRRLGEPLRHSSVFGRYKTPAPGFAGLRVAGRQARKRPLQVIDPDGAIRRDLHHDAPDGRIGMLGPDGRNGYQTESLGKVPWAGAPSDDQPLEQSGLLGKGILQASRRRIAQPGEQGGGRDKGLGSKAALRCAQIEVQAAGPAHRIRCGRRTPWAAA